MITDRNDYVLIYYSGHGDNKAESAYWIPKDGNKKWSSNWIIKAIRITLEEIKAHHISFMVDSCYLVKF